MILLFHQGAVCLPRMFGGDFGDQIGRFVTLTDPKGNKFEVLVDAINGNFFLTKGWKAIRIFYGLGLGAWVTLIFVDAGRFDMKLTDRFHNTIKYPIFDPPMNFLIDKTNVPTTFNQHLQPRTSILCYRHNISDMIISFEKKLSHYDVTRGALVRSTITINFILFLVFHLLCVNSLHLWFLQILIYTENIAQMLDTSATNVKFVDDCGNVWDCDLIFGTLPYEHCRMGGQWKRFVEARRLREGVKIRLGALKAGMNELIYLDVVYN
jgi:hypothetical protein